MFTQQDFDIFDDPTLAGRMNLIKTVIDPKFEAVAPKIMQQIQPAGGAPFYAHVAKHLRRFKNPPVDTWVAFSQNKRSYKAWPHFELGLWPDRLFMYFDVLDEGKASVQAQLSVAALTQIFNDLPTDMVVSNNHGVAATQPATPENVAQMLAKFDQYKHSELVVGRSLMKTDPIFNQPEALEQRILTTFTTLMSIYQPIMAALEVN
ncbi:DUF1054 domain-containing protein [Lactiplantibacillus carotarum]|uniref:DUF1054 domain-containing protein n=1 Tax=Lactiplantibacillus carotarum TaxID=2993456 RepID=UPI00298F3A73|nr:DUF1054 domain-containing protein [Lactiplantibacillus carotarum]